MALHDNLSRLNNKMTNSPTMVWMTPREHYFGLELRGFSPRLTYSRFAWKYLSQSHFPSTIILLVTYCTLLIVVIVVVILLWFLDWLRPSSWCLFLHGFSHLSTRESAFPAKGGWGKFSYPQASRFPLLKFNQTR